MLKNKKRIAFFDIEKGPGSSMPQKDNLSEIQQYQIQEIMNEICECREDERAGRNQIFTILAIIAAFIAAIFTLLSFVNDKSINDLPIRRESLALGVNTFSTLLLGASVPWIANLGFLSTFRHFYIIELETQLSNLLDDNGREFYHWESISTPVITFNLKHILPGYPMLYSLNMYISFISILTLAVAYVIFVQLFAKSFSLINMILTVGFWIVFIISVFTIVAASVKSKDIYFEAKKNAKNRRTQGNYKVIFNNVKEEINIFHFIMYFLYPRLADIQKNLFLVIGFFFGLILLSNVEPSGSLTRIDIKEAVYRVVYSWFILDFLVYQARYLWNDLRGIDIDISHPERGKRKRLPVDMFGDRVAIILALGVMMFRLSAAFVLIIMYGEALRRVLVCGVIIILLISAAYEYAKTTNNAFLVFILVPWGYPVRFFFGVASVCPFLFQQLAGNALFIIVFSCVLLATAAFGEVFVSLTWCLDAVYLKQNNAEMNKKHYEKLYEQVPEFYREKDYPLVCKDSICTIWNKWFFCSVFFLSIATSCISSFYGSDFRIIGVSVLSGLITILIAFVCSWNDKMLEIGGDILLIILAVLECVYQYLYGIKTCITLYVALIVLRTGYSMIYLMFRHSNYQKLISFGTNIKNTISKGTLFILKALLGGNAYRKLFKRM